MTLAHVAVGEKTNEIPTIPDVIKNLDIAGTFVTIDAMGCQTAIASAIRSKKADYLLAVKDNQPALHDAIRNYFAHCTTKSWLKKTSIPSRLRRVTDTDESNFAKPG
jgi:predicted transposase YbfD/YdcC